LVLFPQPLIPVSMSLTEYLTGRSSRDWLSFQPPSHTSPAYLCLSTRRTVSVCVKNPNIFVAYRRYQGFQLLFSHVRPGWLRLLYRGQNLPPEFHAKVCGSFETTDSTEHAMFRLESGYVTEKFEPLTRTWICFVKLSINFLEPKAGTDKTLLCWS
jgi:hypothetical protein